MNKILVEVSVGELFDRISILEIKKDKTKDTNNLKFINEEYVVNGQKVFCTNAGVAGTIIITARILDNGIDKGIGAFIVETGTPGLTIGNKEANEHFIRSIGSVFK